MNQRKKNDWPLLLFVGGVFSLGISLQLGARSPQEHRHRNQKRGSPLKGKLALVNAREATASFEDWRFLTTVEAKLSQETLTHKTESALCAQVPLNLLGAAKRYALWKAHGVGDREGRVLVAKRVAKLLGVMSLASGFDTASVDGMGVKDKIASRASNGGTLMSSHFYSFSQLLESRRESRQLERETRFGLLGIRSQEVLDRVGRSFFRNAIDMVAESDDSRPESLKFFKGDKIAKNCFTDVFYQPADQGVLEKEFNGSGGFQLFAQKQGSLTENLGRMDRFGNQRRATGDFQNAVMNPDEVAYWGKWLSLCPFLSFDVGYSELAFKNWTSQTDSENAKIKGFFSEEAVQQDTHCERELVAELEKGVVSSSQTVASAEPDAGSSVASEETRPAPQIDRETKKKMREALSKLRVRAADTSDQGL